jgi:hypothetical protein
MGKEFQILVLRFMTSISGIIANITPVDIHDLDRLSCDIDDFIDKIEEDE